MRSLIAGNWKMNGCLTDMAAFAAAIGAAAPALGCDLLVCPPFTLVAAAAAAFAGSGVAVGGQDCHFKTDGAHTGDIAASMLREAGAAAVILGHSERRADHGETDAIVRAKVEAAQAAGLLAVVCVGELGADRQAGRQQAVVGGHLAASLPDDFAGVIAYEPIWAIGTGRTPTEREVGEIHGFIRATLSARFGAAGTRMRILYGGSVKPANAAALLAVPEVGGALVGGASLHAGDFLAIARAAPSRAIV
jgi:triosephosphate isomerase